MSELPSAASKAEIRTVLRQIPNEAGTTKCQPGLERFEARCLMPAVVEFERCCVSQETCRLRRQPGKRRVVSAAEIGAVEPFDCGVRFLWHSKSVG